MIYRFQTRSGIRLERSATAIDYDAGIDFLIPRLDGARGAYFSSGVEDPDRYSRWDFGFVEPPVAITASTERITVAALNRRGLRLLDILEPVLVAAPGVGTPLRRDDTLTMDVLLREGRFPEEERSRQPSVFSPLRALIDEFRDLDDGFLGFYGAFGFDLIYQFEPISLHKPRDEDETILHLYLPDRIYVVDRRLETAVRYDYEFADAQVTTAGLARGEGGRDAPAPPSQISVGAIATDVGDDAFAENVETARQRMVAGDVFEVVLSRSFSAAFTGPASMLFTAMRKVNPSPYEFLLQFGEEALIGASPEMFVRVEGDRVESCPISGTIRRGATPMEDAERIKALYNSAKDEAELTMCTDVDRNDKARICRPGSVRLLARRLIERYAGLFHTVDHVEGRLRDGFDGIDAFLSHMWAVTLTGAPKRMAVEIIEKMENTPRGWYGGAIGVLGLSGAVNTGITIRTVHLKDQTAIYRAGASLVYDSVGKSEADETRTKAAAFFRIVDALRGDAGAQPATPHIAVGEGRCVLVVDYEDSFVHMLADYFRQTGAAVETYRWDLPTEEILASRPHLVVHSPGPGRPERFDLAQRVRAVAAAGLPQFGVCLGLQGMVEAFGGEIALMAEPRHGKTWTVTHTDDPLFADVPSPLEVGAYHSLYVGVDALPSDLQATARTENGMVMALRHRVLPVAGVQFHPESILSLANGAGLTIVSNAVAMLTAARDGNGRRAAE